MDGKTFLQQKFLENNIEFFGHDNNEVTKEIARIRHDDSKSLNGRWKEIESFDDHGKSFGYGLWSRDISFLWIE
ncbi:MAG: hypothetical protein ABJH06_19050 [Paraglaciecola sp.]|uniref:hypothetical protein n=1 Tax=Paraglaciecola sp. TaxID=1920173 RepID=UPI003298077A